MFARSNLIRQSVFRLAAAFAVVSVLYLISLQSPYAANAATLHFNPSTLTVGLSETAEVQLVASSPSQSINSVEVTLSYPTNLVLGVEATAKGTVFPITVFPATVDNTQGRATFTVSVTTPGYTGSSGVVGTLMVRGQKLGQGEIKVVSAKIIANDGSGTNVYVSSTPAKLVVDKTVIPKYTTSGEKGPVPIVNSPSHPDPSKWYAERTVQFTWTGGTGNYSWVFDQNADTLAPAVSKGSGTSTTISGVGDGVWYIHVRAESGDNWGPTTTFRVQIDGSPPGAFQLKLDPDNTANPSALPLITFEAPDTPAGIEYYELSLDGSDPVKTRSPYQVPQLKAGSHTIDVWAVDKAGNKTKASATINLVPLSPTPAITNLKDDFSLTMGDDGKISGTGPAGAIIQLYANDQYVMSVKAGDDGKYELKLIDQLEPGDYTFKVKAVKPNHLDSAFSNQVKGKVIGGGIIGGLGGDVNFGNFKVPFWVTLILYIIILLLLIALLIYLYIRWRKARRDQKLAMQKLELMTNTDQPASPIPTDVGQSGQAIPVIQPVPSSDNQAAPPNEAPKT